jgi:F-type H+-transporting ATPase subunit b
MLASSSFVSAVASGDEPRSLGMLLEFMGGAALWTWVAFLVGLVFMWKFVYGPITRALEDRDQKVEDAIKAAEVARQQAEQQMAQAKQELQKAQADGKRMVEEAMARAERQAAEAVRAADERAKQELHKAREAIGAEKQKALQEIRAEAVALTIAATSRLLEHSVDDGENRRLVERFVQHAAGAARG